MKLRDLLAAKGATVETIGPGARLADVAARLTDRRIGALVVTDPDGQPVGIVSERDVVRLVAGRGPAALAATVREAMTAPVTTRGPDDDVLSIMSLMTDQRIRHVPVVEGGRLCGIVSIGDVVKSRLEQLERDRRDLLEYVSAR